MTTPKHLILHTGIAALAVVAAIFLAPSSASAALGDGASSNIRLLDTNANGKIDRITFNVANPSGETWRLVGAFPHGLSVVDAGNGITVSSISFTTAVTANPVGVQANLNESDPDLTVDTSLGAAELVYTAGPADNISDGVDEQVNAILSGDTNATDTETDFAAPVLRTDSGFAPQYEDNDANGRTDRVRLVFSEATTITYADANWTAVANQLDGFDVSGVSSGNGSATIYLTATANAALTGVSGGTEPTLAFSHATNITDGSNPLTSIGATSLVDAAAPRVYTGSPSIGTVYQDSNSDGAIDRLQITFTETISLNGTIPASDFTLGNSGFNGSLSGNASIASAAAIYLSVTGADANETSSATTPTIAYVDGVGRSIEDTAAASNDVVDFSATSLYDSASPRIKSTGGRFTLDNNSNGTVDYVKLVYTESIDDTTFFAANACVSTSSGSCVAGDLIESFTSGVPSSGLETDTMNDAAVYIGIANGTQTISTNTTNYTLAVRSTSLVTDGWNLATAEVSATNSTDGARPILLSTSPINSGTLIPATANFTLTFSEDLLDGSVTSSNITGSATSGTATFDVTETSAGAITADPTGASFSPGVTATITINGDSGGLRDTASNLFNNAGTALELELVGNDGRYSFSTLNPSSGGGGGGGGLPSTIVVVADAVAVTSPNGGEALSGGSSHTVTWTSAGNVNNVNLSYSVDGGATFSSIVSGTGNDGSYIWSVPNIAAASVLLRVVGRDAGGATLATDLSNAAFSIAQSATMPVASPVSSSTPVSMRTQSGSLVEMATGVLFRGVTLPDVYRVNADGTRHVFPNETTFFSWGYSFDQVVVVNDDQLRLLSLGARVTMKPGAYLVKIQSNPKVYEVGEGATLTHIPDEATAASRFGANWAGMVRDIPVVFFGDYITS